MSDQTVLTIRATRTIRVDLPEDDLPEVKVTQAGRPGHVRSVRLTWAWSTDREVWDLDMVSLSAFPTLANGTLSLTSAPVTGNPYRFHERAHRPAWLQRLVIEHAPRTRMLIEEHPEQ